MNISAISGTQYGQNMYTIGKTHYNQVQESPVLPITPIGGVNALAGQEQEENAVSYESPSGKLYQINESRVAKQADEVRAAYEQEETVSYNAANPYEQERMSTEGMLLTGMYVDLLA